MLFLAHRLNESRQGTRLAHRPRLADHGPNLRATGVGETASPIVVTDLLLKRERSKGRDERKRPEGERERGENMQIALTFNFDFR